jgi:uncharacterized protein YndB with AHSA1/START domain
VIKDNTVVYEVHYPHPPERVWRALVDPAELARWLMPAAGFAPVAGRKFTVACDPFGEIQAVVLEVAPPRNMTWEWTAAFGTTVVSFELTAVGGGTLLRMVHSGWEHGTPEARNQFNSGWNGKLGQDLAAVLGPAQRSRSQPPFG